MAKSLYDQGIFDHASWTAGISGGSWYVTAHTLASLEMTDGVRDPYAVMQDIKDRVMFSIFGDYFQGNEVRTRADLPLWKGPTSLISKPLIPDRFITPDSHGRHA